ncbi:MAG: aldo/keto reductase [Sedimentisphaerales bacterium]|nr:aldo/keto reductase [Sedimentisphaerales bacterium]
MERIRLGRSELHVSRIAFGTWQLSPRFWGDISKQQVVEAIVLAFEKGINFIDTADAYGDGYGETVVGEAIAQLPRDEVVICTKVYNHFNPDGSRYPDLSRDHVIARCEASLKRLGIETIDLYLLHFYDVLTPLEEVAGALERLRKQGKVRAIGVSNHSVEQFRAQRQFGPYDVIQPPYSLIDPAGEKDLLPYCQAEDLGVMIYSPLHKGLLTGKYRGDETFDDFRKHHPDFQGERFRSLCQAVQSLAPIAQRYGRTIYQLVVATTLMHPAIHVAVCGFKTADQVAEAVGALGKRIERPHVYTIRQVLGPTGTKIMDAKGTRK